LVVGSNWFVRRKTTGSLIIVRMVVISEEGNAGRSHRKPEISGIGGDFLESRAEEVPPEA